MGLRQQRPHAAPAARQHLAHPPGLRRVRPRGDLHGRGSTPTSRCSGSSATEPVRAAPGTRTGCIERWTKLAADDGHPRARALRGGVDERHRDARRRLPRGPGQRAPSARRCAPASSTARTTTASSCASSTGCIFLFTAEDRRDEDDRPRAAARPGAPTRPRRALPPLLLDRPPALPSPAAAGAPATPTCGRCCGGSSARSGATTVRPSLALPALGSFLFGPDACPHLDAAELRNEDLLDAVRAARDDRGGPPPARSSTTATSAPRSSARHLRVPPRAPPRLEIDATRRVFSLGDRGRQRAQDHRLLLHADEPHRLPARLGPRPGPRRGGRAAERPGGGHPRPRGRRPGRGLGPLPRRRRPPHRQAPRRGPDGRGRAPADQRSAMPCATSSATASTRSTSTRWPSSCAR